MTSPFDRLMFSATMRYAQAMSFLVRRLVTCKMELCSRRYGAMFQMKWSSVPSYVDQLSRIAIGWGFTNKCIAKAYFGAFESRRVVVENAIEEMLWAALHGGGLCFLASCYVVVSARFSRLCLDCFVLFVVLNRCVLSKTNMKNTYLHQLLCNDK